MMVSVNSGAMRTVGEATTFPVCPHPLLEEVEGRVGPSRPALHLTHESVIQNLGRFGGDWDPKYQGSVDAFYRRVDGESILKVLPAGDINRKRPLSVSRLSRLIRPQIDAFLKGGKAHGPHLDYAFRDASLKLDPAQLDIDTLLEYLERTARVDPSAFVRVARALFLTHMRALSTLHVWGSVQITVGAESDSEYRTFPLLNRYQSNRNYAELRDALLDVRQDMPCVFLTLTYARDIPLDEALLNVTKDWNRFTARLRHELGRLPEYLMTVEFQKDGYPHIHALFFDTSYLFENGVWKDIQDARSSYASVKTIESMWKRGITYINRTRRGAEVKSPVGYMMKYISKEWGAGRDSPESTLNHALMWITGRRSFNASRALLPFLKANSENPMQKTLDENEPEAEGELKCLIVSSVNVNQKSVKDSARDEPFPSSRPLGVMKGHPEHDEEPFIIAEGETEMKERTKELLEKVDNEHDWIEGQVYSGGGTEYHNTDTCQVCGLRRHYQSDTQNGIEGHYRFSTCDGDISLKQVIERKCY